MSSVRMVEARPVRGRRLPMPEPPLLREAMAQDGRPWYRLRVMSIEMAHVGLDPDGVRVHVSAGEEDDDVILSIDDVSFSWLVVTVEHEPRAAKLARMAGLLAQAMDAVAHDPDWPGMSEQTGVGLLREVIELSGYNDVQGQLEDIAVRARKLLGESDD